MEVEEDRTSRRSDAPPVRQRGLHGLADQVLVLFADDAAERHVDSGDPVGASLLDHDQRHRLESTPRSLGVADQSVEIIGLATVLHGFLSSALGWCGRGRTTIEPSGQSITKAWPRLMLAVST